MADSAEMARRIAEAGKKLDYEQEALAGLQRSLEVDDSACKRLAQSDSGVWATLQLARATEVLRGGYYGTDYEQLALDCIQRSWLLDDTDDMELELARAQNYATLHLAAVTRERNR